MERQDSSHACEFETLAVAMSLVVWHQRLKSTQLVVYIDNEGANYSLIKGYSSASAVIAICALTAAFLDAHCILPWYSRVPSASNLADCPSRQINHPLLKEEMKIPEGEALKPSDAAWNLFVWRKRHMNHGWGPWRKRAA